MQKDLKIGFGVGIVIVAILGLWLATRTNFSINTKLTKLQTTTDENSSTGQRPKPSNLTKEKKPVSQEYPETPKTTEKNLENTTKTEDHLQLKQQNQTGTIQNKSTKTEQPTIIHTIQKGETLSVISKQYYGTENKWQKIFNANRDKIYDANKLRAGTRIIIPK